MFDETIFNRIAANLNTLNNSINALRASVDKLTASQTTQLTYIIGECGGPELDFSYLKDDELSVKSALVDTWPFPTGNFA